jgi:hypothetical protein
LSQLFGGLMIFPGRVKVAARWCDFQSYEQKIQHSLWQDFGLAAVRQVLEAVSFMTSPSRILMALLWCVGYLAILAPAGQAQNPLTLTNTYFVTGDYVVGGWQKPASPTAQIINGVPYVTGTISIPDGVQAKATGSPSPSVPAGADIVAAYLYWETVESTSQSPPHPGMNGFFNGHAFTGSFLPSSTPNAPTSWSSGGCSGSAQGAKTIQGYRADVRPFLPLDTNSSAGTFGDVLANGNFSVQLADSGTNGSTTPFTLGATLVVVYRVLNPTLPLNAIVIYDGIFAPSNATVGSGEMSQQIMGFYQAAASPVAKITHIVGAGQPKKDENIFLNGVQLPSLYGDPLDPFPGIYNGSWDNPTWLLNNGLVQYNDSTESTSVVPTATGGKCLDWGAVVFSTTVQDTDGDGLLDMWEDNQGYTDALSGQWVALPGANKYVKDIFVEIDYLSNLDGKAGNYKHSHLPQQAALDKIGDAFKNAPVDCSGSPPVCKGINVHFDVGPGIYQGDPYVITYPVPLPPGTVIGGNAISESAELCIDGAVLCQFPGQVTTEFKGDLLYLRDNPALGNFQPGRSLSYHYVLFGHALGEEESLWTTFGTQVPDPTVTQLVSVVVNAANTATVTIQSPSSPAGFVINPGDCPNAAFPACSDANNLRVTVSGALGQPALNGTYYFTKLSSSTAGGVTTTIFTIPTAGVLPGTYSFANEPQLAVSYLGPDTGSGHSDFGGGGDSMVTFGLWGADDPANCQGDPSQPLTAGQAYCNNQLGNVLQQAGTLMHELGHTLTLTHGGTYYTDNNNPSVPTYGLNCKPNFLSSMSYLFVVRGFADVAGGGIGYSGQVFSPLDETQLNEKTGIGLDSLGNLAQHYTRWFGPPNALDLQIQQQNTAGSQSRFPTIHCDGSPIQPGEAPAVRVTGNTDSYPIDWNNDLVIQGGNGVVNPQDVNFDGIVGDPPFQGFNDWQVISLVDPVAGPGPALRQIGARAGAFGFSGSAGSTRSGGGSTRSGGGSTRSGGGSTRSGGGSTRSGGGSTEQDENTSNSTADAPTALNSAMSGHNVSLNWTPPTGQVREYDVFRAVGSFPTLSSVLQNAKLFTRITPKGITPVSPAVQPVPAFIDTNVKNGVTYTYFVTQTNIQKVQSGGSDPPTVITVKF